jgi:hypothetical protein
MSASILSPSGLQASPAAVVERPAVRAMVSPKPLSGRRDAVTEAAPASGFSGHRHLIVALFVSGLAFVARVFERDKLLF